MEPRSSQICSRHVAVIGAGASGLVAARELRREGHSVVVFEKGTEVGGLWVYTPLVEPDPMSLDPTRFIVHSSLYSNLRTNLPRESMGFSDFPFVSRLNDESGDPRRYPNHREVLAYLRDFARVFKIKEIIRFETEVVRVEPTTEDFRRWRVKSRKSGEFADEIYDAVVICIGHYTEPRHAYITGIDSWPGKQIHSHNYRIPEPFKNQVVVIIGYSASGLDISLEIAEVAKEVHVVSTSVAPETHEKLHGKNNLWFHSTIDKVQEDGSVTFQNGKSIFVDTIMHCTGYKYHFPFLETNGIVTIDDNRVGPLYKHIFPPTLAPRLSFIGIPWKIVPFYVFEQQSKWVAKVLSGRIILPSQYNMIENVKTFYAKLEVSGISKRFTHRLDESQSEYINWLAEQCGCTGIEKWREQMYVYGLKRLYSEPNSYRDQLHDDDPVFVEAYEDFVKLINASSC